MIKYLLPKNIACTLLCLTLLTACGISNEKIDDVTQAQDTKSAYNDENLINLMTEYAEKTIITDPKEPIPSGTQHLVLIFPVSDDYLKSLLTNQDLVENLKQLGLKDVSDSLNLTLVQNFKHLQALALNDCEKLQTLDLCGYERLQRLDLKKCKNLQILKLAGCENLQTLELEGCENLQEIDLAGCERLQTLDLEECNNLQTLDLRGCSNLPPTTIAALKEALPNCKFEGTEEESKKEEEPNKTVIKNPDESIPPGTKHLVLDFSVSLDYLKSLITNQDLVENLAHLELKDVQKFSGEVDFSFLKGLQNLQALDLAGCENLQILKLNECKNLQNLTLEGCDNLQNLELWSFYNLTDLSPLRGLTNLQWLWLKGCDNLSPSAIAALQKVLPRCSIVK